MSDLRTVGFNRNEPKSANHFIPPMKSPSNIKPPSFNQAPTSNGLSENSENSLHANNVISIEDINAESKSNQGY